MTTLLVGFDSAWTSTNSGALIGVIHLDDGTFHGLGTPQIVDYRAAEGFILKWQRDWVPTATIILLDQPTIANNAAGQRPVENIVGSPVSLRYGGMQPANTAREEMFGKEAPVWPFLARFGGPADPLEPIADTRVFETYPVLTMLALGWTLPDSRAAGRLPKYNPARKKTFSISDWQYVCGLTSGTSVTADSWTSLSGSTMLPETLRRTRAIRTAWMPASVCWWPFTWLTGKTA